MVVHERILTSKEKEIYQPYFAHTVIEQARVINGRVPFWLSKKMCTVVLGRRIYFRKNYYQSNIVHGIELLGHELMHVSQFMHT